MTDELVHLEVGGGVATITLDSPSNRNALSARLVTDLAAQLATAAADRGVRSIVITATGSVFCSGADLVDPPTSDSAVGPTYAGILSAVLDCPKVVMAKLNGHARAGGLGLVAAADVAIAPDDATFAFPEVRIGVAPAIIAVVCTRVMGPRALSRYLLTGETFSATEAMAAGLLTSVADRADIDGVCAALLGEAARAAPGAVARTKQLVGELGSMGVPEGFALAAQVSAELFGSDEGREGILAFMEKRPPPWAS